MYILKRYQVTLNVFLKYNYFIMYLYNPTSLGVIPLETKSMFYHNGTVQLKASHT